MDIVEKVDIPNDAGKVDTGIFLNSFVLPSQSIINHDLTPLKFNDIGDSTDLAKSEKVPLFVANLIDFHNDDDRVMTNHATLSSSTHAPSNPIWTPTDKHTQIAPNGYNDWIKTHTSHICSGGKLSFLSSLSFDTVTDDDSNSSESGASDEDDELVTPTAVVASALPAMPDMLEREQPAKRKQETNEVLLCRQANCTDQEMSLTQIETTDHPQPAATRSTAAQQIKQQLHRAVTTGSSSALGADHHSKKDGKKSWFSGLLHDLKKTGKPQKPKKSGLSSLFSRSSEKQKSPHVKQSTFTTEPPKKLKKKILDSVQRNSKPLPQQYSPSTERALYRLSHVKLGNPKRPLQQQVVISNMINCYLMTQQQQQQQIYHHNERQQVYFNNIYQATYQSFEPPAPGGKYHQHQPHFHSYPTLPHRQQQISSHPNPYVQQTPPPHFNEENAPVITEKPKPPSTASQNKKKKYKPVPNSEYSPLALDNSTGTQSFQKIDI
ncbi:hypothetical protein BD408DRAFT_419217 [Parasitella parasitica]|nr:hypothetical protein BD408DRAFT_419217 [Parasitella parasitica]